MLDHAGTYEALGGRWDLAHVLRSAAWIRALPPSQAAPINTPAAHSLGQICTKITRSRAGASVSRRYDASVRRTVLSIACVTLAALLSVPLGIAADTPCPASTFLDVSDSPGAGPDYPRPRVEATCEGDDLVVRSNGIPHYEFVQITPNPLLERNQEFRFPAAPQLAESPTPIPLLGSIGVAVNGIAIFGPNEGPEPEVEQFGDPVFNAILDVCMGHTALSYHYHAMVQACLSTGVKAGDPSPVLGFGFDGIPIRGPWGCADAECSSVIRYHSGWEQVREPHQDSWDAYRYAEKDGAEYLDQCNGHTGPDGDYHYHVTESWPYIMGCYSGTPVRQTRRRRARPQPPAVTSNRPPPPRRGDTGRPSPEHVASAARELGMDEQAVAVALRVEPGSLKPINLPATARALGLESDRLMEAMGWDAPPPRPRVNQAPPGEPECFFRCGQSDDDAVGCTLTADHEVRCYRPCDGNKCG